MISPQINSLLLNEHKIKGKTPLPIDTIVIGENIIDDAKALVAPLKLGNNPVIVCDEITYIVLGKVLAEILGFEIIILEGSVKADENRITELRKKSESHTALIAVGSGTLNDLCKQSAYLDRKMYIVFPTALSMNGYASANASIETADGLKKSFPARMPSAIFIDTRITSAAPPRLTSSGLADTLCRSTSQADWLLSNFLLETEYNEEPFNWLKEQEDELIKNSLWLMQGDATATSALANSLILGGLGMYFCDGSYPVSQAEHLIAHTMEMMHGKTMRQSYHGEQIAVTTLTMSKLQEMMIEKPVTVKAKSINEEGVLNYFGGALGHHCLNELKKKSMNEEKAEKITQKLHDDWHVIRTKISTNHISYFTLKKTFELAQLPTQPEDIGWSKEDYKDAVKHAFLIRDRFTFLDLAYYSGKLNDFVDNL